MYMPNNRAFADPTPRVWRYKKIKDKPPVVYVIKPDGLDFVKIGRTRDLYPRLSGIQTGCPYELQVLFVLFDDGETEGRIHYDLQRHSQRGEWFRLNAEVQSYLDDLRKMAIDYDAMMDELLARAQEDFKAAISARVVELREAARTRLCGQ